MNDPTQTPSTSSALPGVIERYQLAHDQRLIDDALAAFSPTAVVVDDGHTATGHEEIRRWLETAASEYTWTRTLLDASPSGPGEWLVVQNLTGDFPGGTVDLRYRFRLTDGAELIEELVIAP